MAKGTYLTYAEVRAAAIKGEICFTEAELALEVLLDTGNTHAHFGAMGRFICSVSLQTDNTGDIQ